MTIDFNDTLMFVKIVETGSFTAAAKALDVPKATLSRKVKQLEQRLGVHLLKRTTRRIGLTEAGTLYFERSARIAGQLRDAESAVSQFNASPRGWLRFTAPYTLGCECISPLLPEFMARYPDVRLEMFLTNERLSLVSSDMDLALRIGDLPDSTLSARRLSTMGMEPYASPDYLERYGEPADPGDLAGHRVLAFSHHRHNGRYTWSLSANGDQVEVTVDPVLVANDPPSLFNAVVSGVGIGLVMDSFGTAAAEQGRLRRVLSPWSGPRVELNAVYPPGRMRAPKVRAFVDFLAERLQMDQAAARLLCFQTLSCGVGACAESGADAADGASAQTAIAATGTGNRDGLTRPAA